MKRAAAHEPVLITGPCSNDVLVGEEDWNAIQETLHLLSVPGVRKSIREGLRRRWMSARKNQVGEEPLRALRVLRGELHANRRGENGVRSQSGLRRVSSCAITCAVIGASKIPSR